MHSIHFCTKLGILDASFSQIFSMVLPNTTSISDGGITFAGDFNNLAFALAENSINLCLVNGDILFCGELFGNAGLFDGTFREVFGEESIGDTSSIFLGCKLTTLSLGMYPWMPMMLVSSSIFIGRVVALDLGRVVALGLGDFGDEFFGETFNDVFGEDVGDK